MVTIPGIYLALANHLRDYCLVMYAEFRVQHVCVFTVNLGINMMHFSITNI